MDAQQSPATEHREKEAAAHSSVLAWEIPRTEEPGRLQFMGSQKELDTTYQLKGNYIQYPVISHNGKEYTYKCTYMHN